MAPEPNTIYCGNCADIMATWPDDCIDLTVTSPPYDNLRTYNGYTFEFEAIAQQLYRVTKPGGVVVWVVADATINGSETGTSFRQALGFMEIGFNLHDTMIYRQKRPPLTHKRYEQEFEYMFIFSHGKPSAWHPLFQAHSHWTLKRRRTPHNTNIFKKTNGNEDRRTLTTLNENGRIRGNVWEIASGPKSSSDKIAYKHPAIFPEALARDHVISWSNPGDTVLDPMCGSGTTLKMAIETGRQYVGIDISAEYCSLAQERIKATARQLELEIDN